MHRFLSIVVVGALSLGLAPAAAAATEVPATVQIEDPTGDANFINNGHSPLLGPAGRNHSTPVDASSLADLIKVWFSHDGTNVSVHFLTEAPLPGGNAAAFQAYASPGEGSAASNSTGCLRFLALIPGTNPGGGSYQGGPVVKLHDRCNVGGHVFDSQDGTYVTEATADGQGILTATFPRAYSPLLADGMALTSPQVTSSSPVLGTHDPTAGPGTPFTFVTLPTDTTDIGSDYLLTAGGGTVEPPPPPPPPPPLKTRSGKCRAFRPEGVDKSVKTTVVRDSATKREPKVVKIDTEMGAGVGGNAATETFIAHALRKVQVDTKKRFRGLYVRLEMPNGRDYDLYLYNRTGKTMAHAAGFNPAPAVYNDNENGGHTEQTAEQINGIKTRDCVGYTADVATATGEGGQLTMKLWLGKVKYDPRAEEETG